MTTTTTFDPLVGDESSSEHDFDAADRRTRSREVRGGEHSHVRPFATLRRSNLLQDASTEKDHVQSELGVFEDHLDQLRDVIAPFDDIDLGPLTERVDAFVRRYLPAGTEFTPPVDGWDGDTTVIYLTHTASPTFRAPLVLNEDDSFESIHFTAQLAMEDWYYQLVGEPDIEVVAALDAGGREQRLRLQSFGWELADSYRRISDAIDAFEAPADISAR